MGISRQELENRFDEIAAFADIGPVLGRPAKTYSSGMLIRLAFAVQVALEPDILIIDEALSVGDYFFQQKCFSRIRKMRDNGLTLLFVSHDMGTVRNLCSRAAYLRKGQVIHNGDCQKVIRHYFQEGSALPSDVATDILTDSLPEFDAGVAWQRASTLGRQLLAVRVVDSSGRDELVAKIGDTIQIQVFFTGVTHSENLAVALRIKNRYDQLVTSQNSLQLNSDEMAGAAIYSLYEFEVDLLLEAGLYSINIGLVQNANTIHRQEIDTTEWFGPIQVNWNYEADLPPFHGMFGLPIRGRYIPTNTESTDAVEDKIDSNRFMPSGALGRQDWSLSNSTSTE
jgi:lipopolysaccharide transport system ATP-binding protein